MPFYFNKWCWDTWTFTWESVRTADKDVGNGTPIRHWWEYKWCSHFGKQAGSSSKG